MRTPPSCLPPNSANECGVSPAAILELCVGPNIGLIRKFYSDLRCLETYSRSVHYTYIFYVGPKFTDCFVFHVGTLHCRSNYVLLCYSVRQRSSKQNVFIFRISFVVESCVTIHSMNKVLGHTIKKKTRTALPVPVKVTN